MQSVLHFIRQFRTFLVFLGLELFCIWLIYTGNKYQNAVFFNSSAYYTAYFSKIRSNFFGYFYLRQENQLLAQKIAELQRQLEIKKQAGSFLSEREAEKVKKMDFILARVVNNSTHRRNNYITIDKGSSDGIEPGMGVITASGVVGKVKACNKYFSVVVSLLHSDMQVSAIVKRTGDLGTVKWDGRHPTNAKFLDLSTHLSVKKGDSVMTSGYNAIFPSLVQVGVVRDIKQKPDQTFYDINLELSTKFSRLNYVYVVRNSLKTEQESLEKETFEKIDE